ncbi:hypothetical protein PG989_010342 [Apiospora arundinis]
MKLQRLAWALGLVPLVSSAEPEKGAACKPYTGYKCAEPGTRFEPLDFDDEKGSVEAKRDIDPREADFTTLDSETGINVTSLVRRQDWDDANAATLHARVEDALAANDANEEDGLVEAYRKVTNRGLLEQRGNRRPIDLCIGLAKQTYYAPPYPNAADDDWYDAKNWEDCQDYKLEKKTSAKIAGENAERRKKDPTTVRKYADEHILEIQMVKSFALDKFGGLIRPPSKNKPQKKVPTFPLAVPAHGYQEMCGYLNHYWNGEAQKILIDGKKAWDVVGNAWPSSQSGSEHDGEEMIKLETRVNGVKARVFGETAIFAKEEQEKAKMDINKASEFIRNMKEMILVAEYMQRDEVQKIFKKQGDRVKANFKKAEDGLEKNWANDAQKYIKQGLDTMWADWLKKRVTKASEKLAKEISDHAGILDDFIEQRKLFDELEAKKPEKDRKKITKEEQKLLDEMKASTKKAKLVLSADHAKPMIPNPWA